MFGIAREVTGADGIGDAKHCINVKTTLNPLTVTLPNSDQTHSSHTALLDLPEIPPAASKCHIFPQLKNKFLLFY